MSTTEKQYLSCAETAKLVRKALKAEFPGQKFSVRSETYSGGASIHVRWTDGPTQSAVQSVLDLYSGATFDGMIDLKSHHDSLLVDEAGEMQTVHFGADFIFAERAYSQKMLDGIATMIEHMSGLPCDLSRIQYDKKWRRIGGHNGDGWESRYPLCVIRSDSGLNVMYRYAGEEYGRDLVHQWAQDKSL